jgi:hypothetical protein
MGMRGMVVNGKANRRKTRLGDRKRSEICGIKPKPNRYKGGGRDLIRRMFRHKQVNKNHKCIVEQKVK